MKAEESTVDSLLDSQKTQFVIPVYQRNYVWREVHCKQLMDDIGHIAMPNHEDESHFIGSIVYVSDGKSTATKSLSEHVVIDGQQRLTTITLIYLAICRAAKDAGDVDVEHQTKTLYLVNQFFGNKMKLRATENNQAALEHLLRGGEPSDFSTFSRVIDNFAYLQTRVTKDNFNDILGAVGRLKIVQIGLDRNEDPQRIFESLNSTGQALTQSDLIRNYILMGLTLAEQKEVYEGIWRKIEEFARDENLSKDMVSAFVRDYLTTDSIPNEGAVYAAFKRKFPRVTYAQIRPDLEEMLRYARLYNLILNPGKEPDADVRRQLEDIKSLGVNVLNPFLMRVFDDFRNKQLMDKDAFIAILELMQSYIWRRLIVDLATNALNKVFMNLHTKVDKSDYLRSIQLALFKRTGKPRFPKDGEVLAALEKKDMYNIKSQNRGYFFRRMENHQNPERVDTDDSNITVEHIFPRNPSAAWTDELGKEVCETISDEYLHTVGNLTLTGINPAMGNKSFADKRDMPGGYKDSRLWLNQRLTTLDSWGVPEIRERLQIMQERFLHVWPPLPLRGATSDSDDELNIFDVESATHRKVEYIILFDETKHVKSMAEAYGHVVSTLYQIEPDAFLTNPKLQSKLGLTKDSVKLQKMRQPLAIDKAEIYFVESGFSNNDLLKRMQAVLTAFDLDDDLFIKFHPHHGDDGDNLL